MRDVVEKLTNDDVVAISAYLASRQRRSTAAGAHLL
jgi:cytochrome c553